MPRKARIAIATILVIVGSRGASSVVVGERIQGQANIDQFCCGLYERGAADETAPCPNRSMVMSLMSVRR
jgi:hypothetical protein